MCGVREVNHMVLKLISVAIILGASWGLTRVNHMIFKKVQSFREGLQIRFFVRFLDAIIMIYGIVIAISSFGGFESVWKTMLGGTAILSAILGFAGQDVIKDVLGGLMITLYKPFEIGNRIELEGEITGIVSDITMRHVVLKGLDTQCFIIPNSKLNAMRIRNYSYQTKLRSVDFSFHIGYDSDVEKAMEVIGAAIQESPYSVPGKPSEAGDQYAAVYFMGFEESSLLLRTTVYCTSATSSEKLISDVNLRIQKALKENGIEIPYPYVNLVYCDPENRQSAERPAEC